MSRFAVPVYITLGKCPHVMALASTNWEIVSGLRSLSWCNKDQPARQPVSFLMLCTMQNNDSNDDGDDETGIAVCSA